MEVTIRRYRIDPPFRRINFHSQAIQRNEESMLNIWSAACILHHQIEFMWTVHYVHRYMQSVQCGSCNCKLHLQPKKKVLCGTAAKALSTSSPSHTNISTGRGNPLHPYRTFTFNHQTTVARWRIDQAHTSSQHFLLQRTVTLSSFSFLPFTLLNSHFSFPPFQSSTTLQCHYHVGGVISASETL